MTDIEVRPAGPADEAATEQIEIEADALLVERFGAEDWPPPTPPHERTITPGFVLVAATQDTETRDTETRDAGTEGTEARDDGAAPHLVVGFVHVLELDGHAHLEQLSVLPAFGRRGIGRRLVEAALAEARERGHTEITLRTYAEVPWNAPFYASCGFVVTEPDTPLHQELVRTEAALGLFAYGPRVQMTAAL
ncbi:GNAT family N-acetyltransferase [Microbacterium oxydans]|uniref:GNAT family N-acetyltransferase n=1 Tax=Microbacterium oxydans TaxID=82380 RepID=UPI00226B6EFE|nr:GNAT family N-acetyltransferase [Microbacterium oxydans]WAA64772.1 GNAT family N-acetyltransferase [Microbacterium oxydans]